MPAMVVVLTAGMGAGHDRVAGELRRRLVERGIACEVLDVWDLLPLRLGQLITGFYKVAITHAPWLYEGIYAIWLRPAEHSGRRASPVIRMAGRRLERWMAQNHPAAAVSTFHLCSQVLGDMRRRGAMPIETASIVVDFATHGLWVDPDVDIHFCLHEAQAERVRALGGRKAEITGPVVSPGFTKPGPTRAEARDRLGLGPHDRAVLIVAGSWGSGHIERTIRAVAGDGRFKALVVTGGNRELQLRLEAAGCGQVFGWVEDMAAMMIAADAVVENAGGLMAMEAMAVGTPVISFEPIPGHGRENVVRMDEAGVSRYARSPDELLEILWRVIDDERYRRCLNATASRMFRSDVADHVAAMVQRSGRPGVAPAEGYAPA